MKIILALLTILALQGCAHSDPWSRQDTTLQLIATGTFAIDAIQTAEIRKHDDIHEDGFAKNFLGRQPSSSDTYQYFATVAVSHYLISRALPAKWRPFWQGGAIAVETSVIFKNCSLGLGRICAED